MIEHLTEILLAPAEIVAPRLLGSLLVSDLGGEHIVGRIVETEAYKQSDVASHSYRGETERTRVMFGLPGYLYVYFTYGMHYCCNVVCEPAGQGAAVLLRALEPVEGQEFMMHRRGTHDEQNLCSGPAKLTQALAINKNNNGHNLSKPPLRLILKPKLDERKIIEGPRIGISKGLDVSWRFYEANNPFVSKPHLM
jgi:DNA-3-methyladenine glycosylase